jgi:hypothetical protein
MASNYSLSIVGRKPGIGPLSVYKINEDTSTRDVESIGANSSTEPVYSVLTGREKQFIVFVVAFARFPSTLSAHICFPLLPTLAQEMHVSNSLINLTIFSFRCSKGSHRQSLVLWQTYWQEAGLHSSICDIFHLKRWVGNARQFCGLIPLRCLQSTGISGTVALGSGIIADIITNGNRGIYTTFSIMLGATMGPVIGGIIFQYLGWRAVF